LRFCKSQPYPKSLKVNWEQNVAGCCKLGMMPITFETTTKLNCFKQFINGEGQIITSLDIRYIIIWLNKVCNGNTTLAIGLMAIDPAIHLSNGARMEE
jgi:hypothetical protein